MISAKNMFQFAYNIGNCSLPRLAVAWNKYGKDAFTLEVLETWEKDPEQLDKEFNADLEDLYEIWSEKLPKENRY